MKGRRVGLVVDHPRRDLAGLVLLARALVERGAEPVLIPMYQQGPEAGLLGLDALVVNYLRPNNRATVEAAAAVGIACIVLDTEGGVLSEQGYDRPESLARSLLDLGSRDILAGYLFWGQRLADAALAEGALREGRLFVTGCPRFDLCREPWRCRLGPRREDYVLVNANFSLVNPGLSIGPDAERAVMVSTGWPADYVDRLIEDLSAVHGAFVEAVAQLARDCPEQRFLLRPHPFEASALYERRFAEMANVTVSGAGGVQEAIQRASMVLHLNCGSAVEALMLERVPLQLEFLNNDIQREHTPLPRRLSLQVESQEALRAAVQEGAGIAERFDFGGVGRRELEPWFGPLDGRAHARAASAIERVLEASPTPARSSARRLGLAGGRRPPSLGQRLQGLATGMVGGRGVTALRSGVRPARRAKAFAAQQVEETLKGLADSSPGPRLSARHARSPYSGLPLASVRITTR